MTKGETWIHYYNLLSQQEAKIWKKPGEKIPTKSRDTRSAGKIIMTISSVIVKVFFSSIFCHVVLQSIVHMMHHSFIGYFLLFGRNVVRNSDMVCCFFTTTDLFTNLISHSLLFSTQASSN